MVNFKFCVVNTLNNMKNLKMQSIQLPGITIVRSKQQAYQVLDVLHKHKNHIAAWDTETIGIDAKKQSPVGQGKLICATAFLGPEVNFGNGPRLFIDNYGENQDNIMIFKDYFENNEYKKVWHNYGYDRHIINNCGIDIKGFGGDTMHMARLVNPSKGPKQYSLSSLSKDYDKQITELKHDIVNSLSVQDDIDIDCLNTYAQYLMEINLKQNLKKIFHQPKMLKSGEIGKTFEFPNIEQIHTSQDDVTLTNWINYSTLDAELTFFLYQFLRLQLINKSISFQNYRNLLDLYQKLWLQFGETLTDIEKNGIYVDIEYLKFIQKQAEEDSEKYQQIFKQWVQSTQPDDVYEFNPQSILQLQTLFFAPFERDLSQKKDTKKNDESDSDEEMFKIQKNFNLLDKVEQSKTIQVLNERGIKSPDQKKPPKFKEMTIRGLGLPYTQKTKQGFPAIDTAVLEKLAGNDKQKGIAQEHFDKQGLSEYGASAREAIQALISYKQTQTLLKTFITPLQELIDDKGFKLNKLGRIHCSININTETGRLSARRPNLQNQPALEKDKYFIRKAYKAENGNKLIIADYSQLELRVLAHMTNCKAMIDAFALGGDFHSRTCISMYPQIKKEVEDGTLLLEWDKDKGEAPFPLLKEKYADLRKKAKTMNFSIAYGKTAHGFSKDWNCSLQEAQQTLKAWYSDRQEVTDWQMKQQKTALQKGYTQTLMGRYRYMGKYFDSKIQSWESFGLRAAINTPIQGGAADIVIAAMVKISQNQRIKELNWKLILQIHDELILEGPEESAQEVLKLVKYDMENPLQEKLRINLDTDAKIVDNWYEGK